MFKILYSQTNIFVFSIALLLGSFSLNSTKAMISDFYEGGDGSYIRQRVGIHTFEDAKKLFEEDGQRSPLLKEMGRKFLREISKREGCPNQYSALSVLLSKGEEEDKIFSREYLLTKILSYDEDHKRKSAEVLFSSNIYQPEHKSIGARVLADTEDPTNTKLRFEAAKHLKGYRYFDNNGEDGEIAKRVYLFFATENGNENQYEAATGLLNREKGEDYKIALDAYRFIVSQPGNRSGFLSATQLQKSENPEDQERAFNFYAFFSRDTNNYVGNAGDYANSATYLWEKCKELGNQPHPSATHYKEAALGAFCHIITISPENDKNKIEMAKILVEYPRYVNSALSYYKNILYDGNEDEMIYHKLLQSTEMENKLFALNKLRYWDRLGQDNPLSHLLFAYGTDDDKARHRSVLMQRAFDGRCTVKGPDAAWALSFGSEEDKALSKRSPHQQYLK